MDHKHVWEKMKDTPCVKHCSICGKFAQQEALSIEMPIQQSIPNGIPVIREGVQIGMVPRINVERRKANGL